MAPRSRDSGLTRWGRLQARGKCLRNTLPADGVAGRPCGRSDRRPADPCVRERDPHAERQVHLDQGRQQRQGGRQLQVRTANGSTRSSGARSTRDRRRRPSTRLASRSTTPAAGAVPQADLEDDEEPLPPYDGPKLPWMVKACKAPDGSYWALQKWQRMLPNLGISRGRPSQKAVGAPHLPLARRGAPARAVSRLGLQPEVPPPVRQVLVHGRAVHGFKAPRAATRSTTTGATSTSTRTTRRTARAGSARTRSSCINPRGNFCYGFYMHDRHAGTRAARSGRWVTGRSTAGRSWAPA